MPSSAEPRAPQPPGSAPRHTLAGGCHCGNIRVQLELTGPPASYHPRACDCDFCRKHAAAYVSDNRGSLRIRIRDERQAGRYRQGSGTAELLVCRECGVLVGALYRDGGQLYAAVNARVIDRPGPFGAEQVVSPQTLTPPDRVKRWQDIWFADVSVVAAAA